MMSGKEFSLDTCIECLNEIDEALLKREFPEFDIIKAVNLLRRTLAQLRKEEDIELSSQDLDILSTFERFCVYYVLKRKKIIDNQRIETFLEVSKTALYNIHSIVPAFKDFHWVILLNNILGTSASIACRLSTINFLITNLSRMCNSVDTSYSSKFLRDFKDIVEL